MANKIRVLQVPGSLRVGGLETVALNLYRFCDKDKYCFDYMVYGEQVELLEAEVEELGGRVFHVPYPHNGLVAYIREMKRIMQEYGPYDVVHAHSLFNSGFVVKAAKDLGIAVRVSHAHSDRRNTKTSFPRNLYNGLMRCLINRYSTTKFACSQGAGQYLYGCGYNDEVYVMRNGIDVSKFKFDPVKRDTIKKEFGWENNRIVGHNGRLVEVKNQKRIIQVFADAYRKDQDLRLIIAGDGELRNELQEQIDALGLSDVVRLVGTRDDVPSLLSAFDVYIMPSHYEGVSISLIEAQASGVHCLVSSNAAAIETRLTDCINVLELTDADDVWSNQIIQLSKKERVLNSASKIIESGYDISEIVRKALSLYGDKND